MMPYPASGQHVFQKEGDRCVKLNEGVELYFPKHAAPCDVLVKYSVKWPSLTLEAFNNNTEKPVKCFKKHVEVRFTKVPEQLLQNIRFQVDGDEITGDCHRYYEITGEDTITLFTKHFSEITPYCNDHTQKQKSEISFRIFRKKHCAPDKMDLKVFLTTRYDKSRSINDEQYEQVCEETGRLNVPSQIDENTKIRFIIDKTSPGWTLKSNSCKQDYRMAELIACSKCPNEIPEATALKFHRTNGNDFKNLEFTLKIVVTSVTEIITGKTKKKIPWTGIIIGGVALCVLGGGLGLACASTLAVKTCFLWGCGGGLGGAIFGGIIDSLFQRTTPITRLHEELFENSFPIRVSLDENIFTRQVNNGKNGKSAQRTISEVPPAPKHDLQDKDLVNLSHGITDPGKLRRLSVSLDIEIHVVDTCLTDNPKSITEAAYKVLDHWFKSKFNKMQAFKELYDALCNCKFFDLVRRLLPCVHLAG